MLPYETTPHAITGALVDGPGGKPSGMANDPTGVGFRCDLDQSTGPPGQACYLNPPAADSLAKAP